MFSESLQTILHMTNPVQCCLNTPGTWLYKINPIKFCLRGSRKYHTQINSVENVLNNIWLLFSEFYFGPFISFNNNQLLQMLCRHCSIFVNIAQVKYQTNIEQNDTVVRDRSSRLKDFKVDPGSHMPSIRYYSTYKCIGFIWWFGQMRASFVKFRAKWSHLWIVNVFAKNLWSNWPRYRF